MPLSRPLAWSLCLVALCAATPWVSAAQPAAKPAAAPSAKHAPMNVALLGGKLRFTLAANYTAAELPPGDASTGTAGAHGTLYMNEKEKRIVVATQMPIQSGTSGQGDADAFLANASEGFISRQAQGLPDFHKTSEKRVSLKGLPAQQIDATASIGGGKTLTTYFIAGIGQQMAVVQVISREADRAGHDAMIKRIVQGL